MEKKRGEHPASKRDVLFIVLGTLGFAFLLVLPVLWGVQPIPYHLGYVAIDDIRSRVAFPWPNPEEEARRLEAAKREAINIYQREAKWIWMRRVLAPLTDLLVKTSEMISGEGSRRELPPRITEEALAFAKERFLEVTEAQMNTIVSVLHAEKLTGSRLYRVVVEPIRETLDERVYARGVLADDRFQEEIASPRQRIAVGNPASSFLELEVTAGLDKGPLSLSQVAAVLDEQFAYALFETRSPEFRTVLRDILMKRMQPTLRFDEVATTRIQKEVEEAIRRETNEVHEGEILLRRGETVDEKHYKKLRAEDAAYRQAAGWSLLVSRFLGKILLLWSIVLGVVLTLRTLSTRSKPLLSEMRSFHGRRSPPSYIPTRYFLGLALETALLIGAAHLLIFLGLPATLLPIGIVAGITALGMGVEVGYYVVTGASLILLVLFEGQPGTVISFLGSGWLYARGLPPLRHRMAIFHSATRCGLVGAALVIAWGLATGEQIPFQDEAWWRAIQNSHVMIRGAWVLVGWLISGVATILLIPAIEAIFGTPTHIHLQALLDHDHPCLRELAMVAPGTYHHSLVVATLAEAAAQAIGANSLLVRVGSYFHDIGKLTKPEYFSENESGASRHDFLNPTLSALIIIAHVKDGVEMGRAYGLPRRILEIIEQHHGRSLVVYFYHRAKEQAEGRHIEEEQFRYPGPNPTSKEAAIVLLADSVEAASRSLGQSSPAHLKRLVHDILTQRLLDRQLDDSGLTLTELALIEQTFVRVLTSMYHARVRYPGQITEEEERRRR